MRPFPRKAPLAGDFAISMATQGIAALLGLWLIKLSVSLYSPAAYGTAALLLGLSTLGRSLFLQPFIQYYLLHYWEQAEGSGRDALVRRISRILGWICLGSLPLLWYGAWLSGIGRATALIGAFLVAGIVAIEGAKALGLVALNLHQRQAAYGLWTLLDATLKPICLLLTSRLLGPNPMGVLVAYVLGGGLVYALMVHRGAAQAPGGGGPIPHFPFRQALPFLAGIAGLGITGWIMGVGDRYVLSRVLGLGSAGLYSGMYALFGAPFLILTTSLTLVVRPKLQALLRDRLFQRYRSRLAMTFLLFLAGATTLALGLHVSSLLLIRVFLKPEYALAASALPGILIGLAIQCIGGPTEIHLLLRKRTGWILVKQTLGSLAALGAIPILVIHCGIRGAGLACIVYFGLDALVGLGLTLRSLPPPDASLPSAESS